jgi:hypothetical protein
MAGIALASFFGGLGKGVSQGIELKLRKKQLEEERAYRRSTLALQKKKNALDIMMEQGRIKQQEKTDALNREQLELDKQRTTAYITNLQKKGQTWGDLSPSSPAVGQPVSTGTVPRLGFGGGMGGGYPSGGGGIAGNIPNVGRQGPQGTTRAPGFDIPPNLEMDNLQAFLNAQKAQGRIQETLSPEDQARIGLIKAQTEGVEFENAKGFADTMLPVLVPNYRNILSKDWKQFDPEYDPFLDSDEYKQAKQNPTVSAKLPKFMQAFALEDRIDARHNKQITNIGAIQSYQSVRWINARTPEEKSALRQEAQAATEKILNESPDPIARDEAAKRLEEIMVDETLYGAEAPIPGELTARAGQPKTEAQKKKEMLQYLLRKTREQEPKQAGQASNAAYGQLLQGMFAPEKQAWDWYSQYPQQLGRAVDWVGRKTGF